MVVENHAHVGGRTVETPLERKKSLKCGEKPEDFPGVAKAGFLSYNVPR